MSTLLSLPPEVMDLIVEALALKDQRFSSVKAFSLVCHAILPHCRNQLFSTISLFKYPEHDVQTADTLLELLTTTPELGPHIHSIIIIFGYDEPPRDLSMLPFVAQKLTALQSLHLVNAEYPDHLLVWNQAPNRHALLPLLHFPTLTHLKLDRISGFSLSDLASCSGLKDLDVSVVDFEDGPVTSSTVLQKSIALDSFSMTYQDLESLRSLCSARRSDGKPVVGLITLKKLSIQLRSDQELRELAKCFGVARHLKRFKLEFNRLSPRFDGLYDILRGSLKTLKHLEFNITISDKVTPDDTIPGLSCELGKMAGRNTVESIKIVVHAFPVLSPKQADEWDTLDHTLSEGGWPALKYVSVVIMVDDDGDLEQALFQLPETRFGGLTASSAIQFEFDIRDQY